MITSLLKCGNKMNTSHVSKTEFYCSHETNQTEEHGVDEKAEGCFHHLKDTLEN